MLLDPIQILNRRLEQLHYDATVAMLVLIANNKEQDRGLIESLQQTINLIKLHGQAH